LEHFPNRETQLQPIRVLRGVHLVPFDRMMVGVRLRNEKWNTVFVSRNEVVNNNINASPPRYPFSPAPVDCQGDLHIK
jgi:hypothetical protein